MAGGHQAALAFGDNELGITVTLDGRSRTYTITVTRALPELGFDEPDHGVGEGDGEVVLTVNLDPPYPTGGDTVTVDYAATSGTATEGEDYTATPGTLSFAPGETSKMITVPLLDNDNHADDRLEFSVVLSGVSGATLPGPNASVRIANNDVVTASTVVTETVSGNNENRTLITEGEDFAIRLQLDRMSASDISYTIGNVNITGTAVVGTDFNFTGGGAGQRRISVTAGMLLSRLNTIEDLNIFTAGHNDLVAEPDKTIIMNWASGNTSMLEPPTIPLTITIIDDDPPAPVMATVTPGDARLTAGWAAADFATGYKVQWKSGVEGFANAATDGREVVIGDGAATSHTITGLTNDIAYDVQVIATRTLTNATEVESAASAPVTETPTVPVGLSIAVAAPADEGGEIMFTVTLSPAASGPVTVDYATSDDTATAGADYAAASGALTFAAGDGPKTFTVATTVDTDAEPDETFTVTLSNPTVGAVIATGAGTAIGTIVDDDPPAQVTGVMVSTPPSQNHALAVVWDAAAFADGYIVQWKYGHETFEDANADGREAVLPSGTTAHTITGLIQDLEPYHVQVIATRTLSGGAQVESEPSGQVDGVTTGRPVVVRPMLVGARAEGVVLTMTFDLPLDETAVPFPQLFAIVGVDPPINSGDKTVTVNGVTVTLTLTVPDDRTLFAPVAISYQNTDDHATGSPLLRAEETGALVAEIGFNTVVANYPATGAPVISGTAQVGEVLTTDADADGIPDGIVDGNGLTAMSAGFTWQWVRMDADGMNPSDIVGATLATYALTPEDAGGTVGVRVSFTDDDNYAGTLTSAAWPSNGTIAVDPDLGICGRTEAVRDALLAAIPGVVNCAYVTAAHLDAITGELGLSSAGITALVSGDFAGLSRVTRLRLTFNRGLTTLPADVFVGLPNLEVLHLGSDGLTTLDAGAFNGLSALTILNMDDNALSTLPDGVFAPLTSLDTLNLADNPGVDFAPTAAAVSDSGTVLTTGGTVTLTGSAPQPGNPWGDNVTYGWELTSPSGVTVTFDDDTIATPEVTIPSGLTAGAELAFTLIVAGAGSASNFSAGIATVTVTVTVTVTAPPSDDATLSGLTLANASDSSPIGFNETFAAGTTAYTVDVANDVDTVTLSATATDTPAATVAFTGDIDATTPGEATFSLSEEANILTVTVTAADGSTRQIYTVTVTVTREAANVPELSISASATRIAEGDDILFTLSRTGDTAAELMVTVNISENLGDELADTATATFGSGSATAALLLPTDSNTAGATANTVTATIPVSLDGAYVLVAGAASASVTVFDPAAGICPRTPAVRDALLAAISGVTDCVDVTAIHLAAITGSLDVSGESITALAAGDFAGLTGLRFLDLDDNGLTTLPDGVFAGLTALEILSLDSNALTTLPARAFDGLTSLEGLRLALNGLNMLDADSFAGLPSLTQLQLDDNALTTLPAGVFDELTSLVMLWLGGNGLTMLPAGVFDELTLLETLWLDRNDLPAPLPDDVFEPLTMLTDLRLSGNPGAPFAPVADALPDDGTVATAGGDVALTGSAPLAGNPWGDNVTYGWTSTTNGVTFDDDASATPVVTIPALTAGATLTFTLTVTGAGGTNGINTATDTATVTATAPPSDDATLGGLTVNDGTNDHTIDLATPPPYTLDVANAVTSVTLTATLSDSNATVSIVTLGGTAIADGDFSDGITVSGLLAGANEIVLTVTAENADTRDYTLTVTRTPPPPSAPPTGDDLVSNTAQVATGAGISVGALAGGGDGLAAQRFTAGGNETGYLITQVSIHVTSVSSGPAPVPTLHICSRGGNNPDLDDCTALTLAGTFGVREVVFDAPPGGILVGSEQRRFLVAGATAGGYELSQTAADAQTGAARWEMHNRLRTSTNDGASWSNDDDPLRIAIRGETNPPELGIVATSPAVAEGDPVSFTLLRTGNTGGPPLTVTVEIDESLGDELAATATATFGSGTATAVLELVTDGDTAGTTSNTVTAMIATSSNGGYVLDPDAASASVTVFDPDAGICLRTPAVRDALVARLTADGTLAAGATCADATDADLASITPTLELSELGRSFTAFLASDLAGLSQVSELVISGNAFLTSLPSGAFAELTALTTLDLYSNSLQTLPADAFDGLDALEELYLDDNVLASLPADVFDGLTSLEALDLDENVLETTCSDDADGAGPGRQPADGAARRGVRRAGRAGGAGPGRQCASSPGCRGAGRPCGADGTRRLRQPAVNARPGGGGRADGAAGAGPVGQPAGGEPRRRVPCRHGAGRA